jgi:hypothetical protein
MFSDKSIIIPQRRRKALPDQSRLKTVQVVPGCEHSYTGPAASLQQAVRTSGCGALSGGAQVDDKLGGH